MKARELMEELFARADEPVRDTVDTCKAGSGPRGTGARTCSSRTSRPITSTATTWVRSRTTP